MRPSRLDGICLCGTLNKIKRITVEERDPILRGFSCSTLFEEAYINQALGDLARPVPRAIP